MARIVVIGSVAQDDVVWLLQPLREGRHLDAHECKLRLGGGGANTAIPLRHAGHHVALVAPVGADPVGEWLLAKVQAAGIDASAMMRVPGESTRSLVLLDADGERTIVNLHRCRERRRAAAPARARGRRGLRAQPRPRPRAGSRGARRRRARRRARPAARGGVAARATCSSAPSRTSRPSSSPALGGGLAIGGDTLRWVMVTRGEHGARPAGERAHRPCRPGREVVDTTAAGDVFAAGLVHALVRGRPMAEALQTAVAWGAATVACAGLPGAEAIASLA